MSEIGNNNTSSRRISPDESDNWRKKPSSTDDSIWNPNRTHQPNYQKAKAPPVSDTVDDSMWGPQKNRQSSNWNFNRNHVNNKRSSYSFENTKENNNNNNNWNNRRSNRHFPNDQYKKTNNNNLDIKKYDKRQNIPNSDDTMNRAINSRHSSSHSTHIDNPTPTRSFEYSNNTSSRSLPPKHNKRDLSIPPLELNHVRVSSSNKNLTSIPTQQVDVVISKDTLTTITTVASEQNTMQQDTTSMNDQKEPYKSNQYKKPYNFPSSNDRRQRIISMDDLVPPIIKQPKKPPLIIREQEPKHTSVWLQYTEEPEKDACAEISPYIKSEKHKSWDGYSDSTNGTVNLSAWNMNNAEFDKANWTSDSYSCISDTDSSNISMYKSQHDQSKSSGDGWSLDNTSWDLDHLNFNPKSHHSEHYKPRKNSLLNEKKKLDVVTGWQKAAKEFVKQSPKIPDPYVHHEDRNTNNKKAFFRPYWDPKIIEKELKNGTLYQGIMRLSKNRQDAYVTSDDLDFDIYVGSAYDRNRALNGDMVAVELLDVEPIWEEKKAREAKMREERRRLKGEKNKHVQVKEEEVKEDDDDDDDEEGSDKHKPKYCGHVVGILYRLANTTFSGTISIDRMQNKDKEENKLPKEKPKELRIAWFKPCDKRMPFILLKKNDIPKYLLVNEEYYKTHLFVAEIRRWQITDSHPTGRIISELGPVGDLLTEKEGILANYSITAKEFSSTALQCLPQVPWVIPEKEFQIRRDIRSERVFSIDPKTAKDLDDALHIKELEDGFFEVGVHIADVSFFLKRNTPLDTEAKERGTSTYLVDSVIPMLPSVLCEDLCSLNPDVDRLAFSVVWKMDRFGKPVDTWFGRTIIRSCAKLAYEDVQRVIDGHRFESSVTIHNHQDKDAIYNDIMMLYKLSVKMRKRRYQNGCLSLNSVKLQFGLNEYGEPISVSKYESKEANRLIEEFMLCANISVAHKISKFFPDEALLRRHQEPLARRLNEFIKITKVLGLDFNADTAGDLQDSFNRIQNETVKDVMLGLAIRCMQRAKYFCSGGLDISKYSHYALNESIYTHFTSPIRRYVDVVVHRLLESALEMEEKKYTTSRSPYNKRMLQHIAVHCNSKKDGAKYAQDSNITLYLCKYLMSMEEAQGPIYTKATVIIVGKDSFEIYVSEYGLEKKIHLEGLPVERFHFDRHSLALDIYWKKGEPVTMYNEEKIYAIERERKDDYSDEEEEEEVKNSLQALALQEQPHKLVDADQLIPPISLNYETCMESIKMFSTVNVRIKVNMTQSPPIINIYPVNPFA